ncbi:MAG TPA: hypothetical protein VIY29_16690 [Ktedonobacteraceae bacterium]
MIYLYRASHVKPLQSHTKLPETHNACCTCYYGCLDYHLPGTNSLELFDRLHSVKGFETVPTLMVSSNPPPHQALQERHIILLEKPFDLIDLLKVIDTLLPKPGA